jgi:GTP cyclohydrolase II
VEKRTTLTRGLASGRGIEVLAHSVVSLKRGAFDCFVFSEPEHPQKEHVALVRGPVSGDDVLVRVHSECLTGEAFDSLHCDCGEQLDQALSRIAAAQRGVVLYLRQEGRGIGLAAKLQAYTLQASGLDTFEANRALGLPEDARGYESAAAMLAYLGVRSIRLLTNNPDKLKALSDLGVDVRQKVAMPVSVNPHNARYLETKRCRAAHIAGAPVQER